jgi:serine/threonine protein kinase
MSVEAGTIADSAIRLGLLSVQQVEEGWEELASRSVPAEEFLRAMERKAFLTPYQSNKLLKGDSAGYFLGGYRILYKVASGSFGRVYRADDPASGRVFALKVLRDRWTKDEHKHKIDLFMREGKMGMSLRHPNIVEILAVNHEKKTNQFYIVMEFVEGGNLRDLLNIRKKLEAPEVLRILEDISAGLAHAFSKGLTHRDMKLTNVLLSSQGPAKLVDFGLAGAQAQVQVQTTSSEEDEVTVDRTIDYAGLEKCSDAPHGDPRSDIFFVGCVAYELLTGRGPLEYNRSAQMRMSAYRYQSIVPMNHAEVSAPPSVFRLIENMMQLDPEERIQTAAQMLDRVRECRAELESAGSSTETKKAQATIFLAESDEKLQDLLRTRLKEEGFRVLIASDPVRALDRFRQQPFDLLIVDAATTGENGYYVFERIMEDVAKHELPCAGILILTAEHTEWQERMAEYANVTVLTQPVKYKQLLHAIRTHVSGA